jgi:putative aminopeptidase FrvX
VISIPTRYAHSYELLDVKDVINAVRLLTATVRKVHKGFSFKYSS